MHKRHPPSNEATNNFYVLIQFYHQIKKRFGPLYFKYIFNLIHINRYFNFYLH